MIHYESTKFTCLILPNSHLSRPLFQSSAFSSFYDPESEQQERKYFIYLISDTANPYYKKDCIGKILLPARGLLTLAELRDQLFKQSEDNVKTILKKGKNFRFLTETYRFVAQNESIASVKEGESDLACFTIYI